MHTPVFLEQVLKGLQSEPGKKIIDCTAGEGGHLKKIAETGAKVLALDYDAEQIIRLREEIQDTNVTLVNANFKDIRKVSIENGFELVDGILMDLGLSFRQLAVGGIGLSYNKPEEPLDMRVEGKGQTAADILNNYSQEELTELFIKNAEETQSGKYAQVIVQQREHRPFQQVKHLLGALKYVGTSEGVKARIFQALRIEVNGERKNLEIALKDAVELLKTEGRLVVITFHSLEDRVVKQFGRKEKTLKEVKVKITHNERASFERSAQLRVFEKIT